MTRPDTLITGRVVVVVLVLVVVVAGTVVVDVLDDEGSSWVVTELALTSVASPEHEVSTTAATKATWCLLTIRIVWVSRAVRPSPRS
jgi:hypothetical protein